MGFAREMKRRARAAAAPVLFLGLAGVFGYSAMQGPHGLVAYHKRQALLVQADADLARLRLRETRWAHKVAALRSGQLDLDLLNERAREMLNLSNPHDILVPYPSGQRLY